VSGHVRLVARFLDDEGGATSIEYAIIASLLSIVIIGAVNTIGSSLVARFEEVSTKLATLGN
jgi:pilus assembly protein Flp/PilA